MTEKPTAVQVLTVQDATMGQTANGNPVIHIKDHAGRTLSRFERTQEDYEMRLAHLQGLKGSNIKAEVVDPTGRFPTIRRYERTDEPVTPGIAPRQAQTARPASRAKAPEELHATLINTCIMQARELLGSGVDDPLAASRMVMRIAGAWYLHFSHALPKIERGNLPAVAAHEQAQALDDAQQWVDVNGDDDIPF